jgi:hypothetical protein
MIAKVATPYVIVQTALIDRLPKIQLRVAASGTGESAVRESGKFLQTRLRNIPARRRPRSVDAETGFAVFVLSHSRTSVVVSATIESFLRTD